METSKQIEQKKTSGRTWPETMRETSWLENGGKHIGPETNKERHLALERNHRTHFNGKKTVSEIHVAQRILSMALVWSSSALVVLA